jgi:hypothetical protein
MGSLFIVMLKNAFPKCICLLAVANHGVLQDKKHAPSELPLLFLHKFFAPLTLLPRWNNYSILPTTPEFLPIAPELAM